MELLQARQHTSRATFYLVCFTRLMRSTPFFANIRNRPCFAKRKYLAQGQVKPSRLLRLVLHHCQVRKKRGTWRLPVDKTTVESRRHERENRRARRCPPRTPPPPPAAASSPPPCDAAGASPNHEPGKLGVRPPPSIVIPQASSSVPAPAPLPQGEEQGSTVATATFPQRRSIGDGSGRVDSPDGVVHHRGSVASTRRSILSFVSARSSRSIEEGRRDGLDIYPANVDDDGDESTGTEPEKDSGSCSGSRTDSDLDEFFDAVAEAEERKWRLFLATKARRQAVFCFPYAARDACTTVNFTSRRRKSQEKNN